MNSLAQTNITRHAQVDLIENDDEIKDKEAELKKIEERIRGINSAAPIYRTKQSAVDVKNVINLDAFSLDRVLSFDPEFLNTEGCVTFPLFDSLICIAQSLECGRSSRCSAARVYSTCCTCCTHCTNI